MNKKYLLSVVFLFLLGIQAFSAAGFEFGIGSGYVFYGSRETKNRNSAISDSSQVILSTDAAFLFPLNDYISFSFGEDSTFDLRWSGDDHIYLIDYAFLTGFRVYPDMGGLFASVDYAIGRRTDFISIPEFDGTKNSEWGNGFKFALGYDFSYHLKSFAPELVVSLKSMPRGGSRDNIFGVSLKLTKHK